MNKPITSTVDDDNERQLCAWMQRAAADELRVEPASLDVTAPFDALGFDSVLVVRLAGALSDHLGVDVDPVLFFEHTSMQRLARHLAPELARRQASGPRRSRGAR